MDLDSWILLLPWTAPSGRRGELALFGLSTLFTEALSSQWQGAGYGELARTMNFYATFDFAHTVQLEILPQGPEMQSDYLRVQQTFAV